MVELSYPEYPRASFLTKLRIKGTLMDPKVSPDKLALLKQVLWFLAAWQPDRWDCLPPL